MEIGGFQRVSLIDYPGKVTSIVFLTGCNLRCPFCHNPDLVFKKAENLRLYPEEEILELLEKSRKFIDAVEITGGEPSLQKDLREFIKKCKALGLSVKLDTNGSNPRLVKDLITERLVDYVAMDIKAPLSKEAQEKATGIVDIGMADKLAETAKILMGSRINYEFRTTAAPSIVTPEDLLRIAYSIRGAKSYYIQQFVPGKTLNPSFSSILPYPASKLERMRDIILGEKLVERCSVRY
jgi:pyruvate formate lyase activating enzyme